MQEALFPVSQRPDGGWIGAAPLQPCRQGSGTDTSPAPEFGLDDPMIPVTALLLSRLLRSASAVGAIALVIASLIEWGLITADPARLS
jgi:hypothetical protein